MGKSKGKIEPCQLIGSKPCVIDFKSFIQPGLDGQAKIPTISEKCEIIQEKQPYSIQENDTKSLTTEKTCWRRYLGIVLALTSTMAYSLGTVCVTLLQKYDPFNLSFWRFHGTLLPAIPLVLYYRYHEKKPIFDPIWPLHRWDKIKMSLIIMIRSICGCTSTLFHIFALQYIGMADTSVIMFSCPVFVTLFAHISLGEKCGVTPILVAIFTICGVVVITRPPMLSGESFDENVLIGTALALAGMILNGLVLIIMRFLRKIHFSFMMTTYGGLGMLESVIVAALTYGITFPEEPIHWGLCGALIFFTFFSQVCLVVALKFENAGAVSLMQSTDVVFAFLWQFIFFSVTPDLISVCGATIVIFGVFMTTFQKWIAELPEYRNERKIFKLLLK